MPAVNGPRVTWILTTLVLVAATQAGVELVRARYDSHVVRPLRRELTRLPTALGNWVHEEGVSAEESGIDARVLAALGTHQAITRLYVNDGLRCSVHIAVWMDSDAWTPHPPDLCYAGAGFSREQHVPLQLPADSQPIVREARYVNGVSGQQATVLYWYQIGSKTYYDRDTARPVLRSLRGKAERPPLAKVLMQYHDDRTGKNSQRVQELATHVYDFVASL